VQVTAPQRAAWHARGLRAVALVIAVAAGATACTVKLPNSIPVCETVSVSAPAEIRTAALSEASRYLDMEYELGGDDHWSLKGIDCSGLVVNAYSAATADGEYWMPFDDATSTQMYDRYAEDVTEPEPGDLAFMGYSGVEHVAIVEKYDRVSVRVIEASSLSGTVSRATYAASYGRLIGYGRLRVRTRQCSGGE
jgi:cell wall-associated NlpC family hydrolase